MSTTNRALQAGISRSAQVRLAQQAIRRALTDLELMLDTPAEAQARAAIEQAIREAQLALSYFKK